MKRFVTLLLVAMAFIGVVAQVETPSRGPIARVEPEEMYFTCMVGETVVDTFYVYNLSSSSVYPVSGFNSDHGYIWTESVHGTIPPGGVGKGIVTYTPEQAGSHHASLSMNIGGEFYGVEFYGEAIEPNEQTYAPSFNGTLINGGPGYMLEIINVDSDEADIYYRVFMRDNGEWGDPTDWMYYEGSLVFTQPGNYRVEAYAVAPGKYPSVSVAYEFVITEVTDCYDFKENGIFYNIIGDGKVSVTCETTFYNSYSGVVSIPNTVTHNGVTYMVTAIGENAFRSCEELTAVTIGDYVTSIGKRAFRNCSNLTGIVLGDYVITVADQALYNCSNLASVSLGKGLNSLGYNAFGSCPSITDVTCKAATPPTMTNAATFDSSVYQSATLHVYPPVLESYEAANYWSDFGNTVGESTVSPKPSDLNGDGAVDIDDVTNLIDILLNGH